MKTKRLSTYMIILCLGAGINSLAAGASETAWDALFNNDYESAHAEFSAMVESASSEQALQGLLLTAWTRADSPEMAAVLSQLIADYPESPCLAAYLSMLGGAEFHGWKTRDRVQALEAGLTKASSQLHRQQIGYELTETLDMLLDDKAAKAAREAGLLIDHWAVIGPFGRFGAADFMKPFGPETGFRSSYTGWEREVEFQKVKNSDQTGLVELTALVQPDAGVAYAVNALKSSNNGDAWLTIYSPAAFQVWWNGAPVAEKAHYFLHTAKSHTVSVPVKAGKNLLVVKSQKTNNSWWVRAALQAKENSSLDVQSVPFAASDFSDIFLTPFEIAKPRTEESAVEKSPYPFELPESASLHDSLVQKILTAVWHLDRGEYETARQILLEASHLAPDFALPYSLYGDVSIRLAEERAGSKPRFHQEAETALRKALELDPHCVTALVGLITYFLDRDQTDQALECINQHLEDNPDVFEKNRSNILLYSYGILYAQKNFDADAASALQQALNGWLPSYEVYRLLFDHYVKYRDMDQASQILEQALNDFPAYPPFLERANQLESDDGVVRQTLAHLRKAIRMHPNSFQYSFLLGETLEKINHLEEASDWYDELLLRYPRHPRLLERKAALEYLQSGREGALAAYQEAFDVAPQHMRPFRALRDAGGKKDFPYKQYDVQLEDVDIDAADRWNESRASGIYLLDIMVQEIHENGSYDQYIHQAIKVMNQEGVRKWAEIVIPSGDNVEILSARTIAPDGTEWDVSNVQQLSGQQSLSMYGVEPGVILEYSYLEKTGRIEPGVNFSGGGYFFGSDDDPMLISKLTIVSPESDPLYLAKNPHDFEGDIIRENGKVIYTWERRMCEGLKPERFAPSLSQRVPSLQWSTCPDWLPFVERERQSIWGYEESSPVIDQLAEEFRSASHSKLEYIQNVYNYVQADIEETSGGFTTADTAILGVGGKYQKLRLARHLLRKGDVDVRLALAVDHEQDSGYRPMPVLSYPGSIVLVIPRQEGVDERIFLDFSSRFAPLGSLDPGLRKLAALIYDADAPFFEPLDPTLWEKGLIDRRFRLTVQEDQSARVEGQYIYDNIYDRQIREALTNPEVKQRLIDSQLTGELRGIQVERSEIVDLDDVSAPPRMVFQGVMPDIAKTGDNRTFKISPVQIRTNAAAFIGEPSRQFRMEFKSSPAWEPLDLRYDLSYFLDQGASIYLPDDVFLITEFGFYSLFYEWDGSELIVRRSFLMPSQDIEPEAYDRFVDFCRTIDQSEDRDIVIQTWPAE